MFAWLWQDSTSNEETNVVGDEVAPVAAAAADDSINGPNRAASGVVDDGVVGAAAAAPPRRGRGRLVGATMAPESKRKVALARAKLERKSAEAAARDLTTAVLPSRAVQTCRLAFASQHSSGAARAKQDRLILFNGTAIQLGRERRAWQDFLNCRNRGAVSHVEAQAAQLAKFITSSAESKVEHIFSVNLMDDASMWVRRPAEQRLPNEPGQSVAESLQLRGKNVHMPVLSIVESMYARRVANDSEVGDQGVLRSVEIHSPSQPLAKANTGTVRYHWQLWSAMTAIGSGLRIDPERRIQAALDTTCAWKTILVGRDNLIVNDCILGLEKNICMPSPAAPQCASSAATARCSTLDVSPTAAR